MTTYWFRKRKGIRSKDLGYGFVPISREGWLSTLVFVLFILFIGYSNGLFQDDPEKINMIGYYIEFIICLVIFIFFAKSKCED